MVPKVAAHFQSLVVTRSERQTISYSSTKIILPKKDLLSVLVFIIFIVFAETSDMMLFDKFHPKISII